MQPAVRAGRIVGVLILIQMVNSVIVNFVLEAPLFGTPGFLVNAAPHARQIALAAVLAVISEALWVAIAVTAFPLFWRHSRALTLWFTALAVVVLASAVIENAAVMTMVSMSEAYAKASAIERGRLEAVRIVVASARNWPHFLSRMLDGCALFVFYAALYRGALVPRLLAGLGAIATLLQITAVGMPLFGHDVVFPMMAPIGVIQLIVVVWLFAKGFRDEPGVV